MVNGKGNARERFKTTIGLISNKAILHVQQIFFVHFFAVVFHDCNAKLPETSQFHVFGRKGHMCSSSLFFTATHFHLALVAASINFLLSLPPLQNFHIVIPTKKCLLFFYLLLEISAAFSSLSFADLRLLCLFFRAVFLLLFIPNLWT